MQETSYTCKLLIVDDEYEIRQGLMNFDYGSLPIEIAGVCSNGLEALRLLETTAVDILLSDIRMPYMDGLELIEKADKLHPAVQKIILSGYDEFEYAKKGMAYGVLDFLLKPLDFGEYMRSLEKAVSIVRHERERHVQAAALERRAKLQARLLRRKFLSQLLQQSMPLEAIETESAISEVYFESGDAFFVILLRFDCYPHKPPKLRDGDWHLIVFALDNLLQDLWSDRGYGCYVVDEVSGECALVATDQTLVEQLRLHNDRVERLAGEIVDAFMRFKRLFKAYMRYAAGMPVQSPADIRLSYLDADAKLSGTIVQQPSVSAADGDEAPSEAEHEAGQASARRLVREARQFIETHYDRSITLDDVAAHVHLNPSYLSHLFKEITGKKYIDYLTAYRVDKAKYYLQHSNHKIYEVGEMVGYENPRYFNLIFKRYTQQSPLEFRLSHDRSDD